MKRELEKTAVLVHVMRPMVNGNEQRQIFDYWWPWPWIV